MNSVILTRSEQKAFNVLTQKSGMVASRDEIAQGIWGERWLLKYSDWQIDRIIYLLRKKLKNKFVIKTLRNSGYTISPFGQEVPDIKPVKVKGTLPTKSYLEYMNNPKNKRKVLKDLFKAWKMEGEVEKVLVVNSYSFDNVDAVRKNIKKTKVYFTNFDQRAVDIHQKRIEELRLTNFHSQYDDIRDSMFRDECFDLIINDFRLNFNLTNKQNIEAMNSIFRILKRGGRVVVSVVVDPRFESEKYGENQEQAPINKDKPWRFVAQEGLERRCFTVPYYKQLFESVGFEIISEFDTEGGKKWKPPYRRFLLKKN